MLKAFNQICSTSYLIEVDHTFTQRFTHFHSTAHSANNFKPTNTEYKYRLYEGCFEPYG